MRPVTIPVPKYTSPPAWRGIKFNTSEPDSTHDSNAPGNQRGRAGQPGAGAGEADAVPAVRPRQMVHHRLLRLAGLSRRGRRRFRQRQLLRQSFRAVRSRFSPRPRPGPGLSAEQSGLAHPAGRLPDRRYSGTGVALFVAQQPGQVHVPPLRGVEPGGSHRTVEQICARSQQPVLVPARAGTV